MPDLSFLWGEGGLGGGGGGWEDSPRDSYGYQAAGLMLCVPWYILYYYFSFFSSSFPSSIFLLSIIPCFLASLAIFMVLILFYLYTQHFTTEVSGWAIFPSDFGYLVIIPSRIFNIII